MKGANVNEDSGKLSDAQMEIMNVVWEKGECAVADVVERLRTRRPVSRNTVQTMMSRLETKGWLTHREQSGAFLFSATVPRDKVRGDCLEQVVETLFDGSAEGLVLALLENRALSKEQAARIRKMIRQAEERQ